MKFVMTQAICGEVFNRLKEAAEIYVANDGDPNHYINEMKDADAVIVRIGKMDESAIKQSPMLKVIGRTGVGYDSVNVKAATKAGIPVVITPGANSRSVAEHTVAMMFAVAKNLMEGYTETLKGNFTQIRDAGKAFELYGKTAGFIGLGAIGRETARICRGIGMKTAAYDPFLAKQAIEMQDCIYYGSYEELIKQCDFISVHVPLTEETKNMITLDHMKTMKKSAVLINCSRSGIVNENDLIAALNGDVIAGAGIDVFAKEPPDVNDPLLKAKNIIVSPHSAAQTREAILNMADMCVQGCLSVIRGEKWPYVADIEVYDHPKWAGK
ncbi:MAG: hydroxyacid dehydrogenase [Christensenellales bacterium]